MDWRPVILIVVDGMRPDALLQAHAPGMQSLLERGAFTLTAQSVLPSITLPAHMSMFHGVPPEEHQVISNLWRPMPGEGVPGIVDVVHKAGGKTAAFYTWEQLRDLWRPGALDYASFVNIYGPQGAHSDAIIARLAVNYLGLGLPDFTFLYLGLVDEIGHRHGWLSPEYQQAISAADAALAYLFARLAEVNLLDTMTILLTADHGGHDHAHGTDSKEDLTVPWVLVGPGIRRGYQLNCPVHIHDTAPTIAHLMDLPLPSGWQGSPILEALQTEGSSRSAV